MNPLASRLSTAAISASLFLGAVNSEARYARADGDRASAAAFVAAVSSPDDGLIKCVAKRPATVRQLRVALRRARRAYARLAARKRAALRRRSRYIAVLTDRDSRSTGKVTCMIFDTETQQVVGENVYDCQSTPPIGAGVKFESYIATFVGG